MDWAGLTELKVRKRALAAQAKDLVVARLRATDAGEPVGDLDPKFEELSREAERIDAEIQRLWVAGSGSDPST